MEALVAALLCAQTATVSAEPSFTRKTEGRNFDRIGLVAPLHARVLAPEVGMRLGFGRNIGVEGPTAMLGEYRFDLLFVELVLGFTIGSEHELFGTGLDAVGLETQGVLYDSEHFTFGWLAGVRANTSGDGSRVALAFDHDLSLYAPSTYGATAGIAARGDVGPLLWTASLGGEAWTYVDPVNVNPVDGALWGDALVAAPVELFAVSPDRALHVVPTVESSVRSTISYAGASRQMVAVFGATITTYRRGENADHDWYEALGLTAGYEVPVAHGGVGSGARADGRFLVAIHARGGFRDAQFEAPPEVAREDSVWTLGTGGRRGEASPRSTRHSPGDGLVVLRVDSSTTSVPVEPVTVELTETQFGFDVKYHHVQTGPMLVEPGHYRLNAVHVGRVSVTLPEPIEFEVRTRRVAVLPALHLGRRRLEPTATLVVDEGARVRFVEEHASNAWATRPWLNVTTSTTTALEVEERPLPRQWRR
ncbi:MAG: hypothetical protein RMA76_35780 [Deltaproteobacteria bacterium]|jgi:hypothetical protein